MLRKTRSFALYPEYFDKKLSKKEGRKVPRSKAVENSNLSKIVYACKYLELNYTIEKDKQYSKNWWKSEGRVVVKPEGIANKTELIRRINNVARKLKKVEKPTQKKEKSKPKQYKK
ncbi:MAG: signal recognition particle subunit SRP19/SEC65 family protein [Candidatus Heimdallarchaeaceae archaeon]